MALTANREVDRYVDQELRSYPLAAGARVYKGGFVGLNTSGYARALVAADKAVGLAYEEADNTAGANADRQVRVFSQGDFALALAGAARTNIGQAVYASADDTLTFTASGNSKVGYCVDVPATGQIILRISPFN